jgi:hypothetical protein
MSTGQFGSIKGPFTKGPFAGVPGMLRLEAMILFRTEKDMLDFAGTIRVDDGVFRAVYHYDPQVAVVLTGAASPADVCRLMSAASDFPGVTHASAEIETVLPVENEEVKA